MTRQEKAEAILHKIGEMINGKKTISFSKDWDDWCATIETDEGYTHIGNLMDDNFDTFVDGLFNLLCKGEGLSFVQVQTLEEKENGK